MQERPHTDKMSLCSDRNMHTTRLLPLLSCALLLSISGANAQALTPEQQALIKKYNISAADQKKLFGTQQGVPVSAQPVTAAPRRQVTTKTAAPAKPDHLLSSTYVFVSGEIYKSIGERITNINGGTGSLTDSFGVKGGFNTGLGIGDFPLRLQIGASHGVYDFKGRIGLTPTFTDREKQTFFTAGLYKRGDVENGDRLSFGLVYDVLQAKQWGVNSNANDISLSQLRGTVGLALTRSTEIGLWATHALDTDRAAITVAGAPGVLTTIHAMNQTNLYVKHNFSFGALVTGYVGFLGGQDIGKRVYGLTAETPLSDYWSVFSNINYVSPHTPAGPLGSGHEQYSASVGLTYYFGGNAASRSVSGNKNLPLLPVAGNNSFLITD